MESLLIWKLEAIYETNIGYKSRKQNNVNVPTFWKKDNQAKESWQLATEHKYRLSEF